MKSKENKYGSSQDVYTYDFPKVFQSNYDESELADDINEFLNDGGTSEDLLKIVFKVLELRNNDDMIEYKEKAKKYDKFMDIVNN